MSHNSNNNNSSNNNNRSKHKSATYFKPDAKFMSIS